jgi:hypothetical protein
VFVRSFSLSQLPCRTRQKLHYYSYHQSIPPELCNYHVMQCFKLCVYK